MKTASRLIRLPGVSSLNRSSSTGALGASSLRLAQSVNAKDASEPVQAHCHAAEAKCEEKRGGMKARGMGVTSKRGEVRNGLVGSR